MLSAILSKEDYAKLPDAVREHYIARNDDGTSYILEVKEVDGYALDEVRGLKSTMQKERTQRQEFEKQLRDLKDAYADLDPAKAREALAKLEKLKDASPEEKVKERIDSAVRDIKAKAEADLKLAQEKAEMYKSQLHQQLVESTIAKAMSGLKLVEGGAELLAPHIQKMIRVEEQDGRFVTRVLDSDGNTRVSMKQGSTDPMSVEELVHSMAEDKRYAAVFIGNGRSGTPAPQRSGSGSLSHRSGMGEGVNLTPEQRLERARGG